jgi:hypothetical protein
MKLSVCRIKLRDCRSLAGGFDRVLSVAGVAVLGCAVLNISSSIPFLDWCATLLKAEVSVPISPFGSTSNMCRCPAELRQSSTGDQVVDIMEEEFCLWKRADSINDGLRRGKGNRGETSVAWGVL